MRPDRPSSPSGHAFCLSSWLGALELAAGVPVFGDLGGQESASYAATKFTSLHRAVGDVRVYGEDKQCHMGLVLGVLLLLGGLAPPKAHDKKYQLPRRSRDFHTARRLDMSACVPTHSSVLLMLIRVAFSAECCAIRSCWQECVVALLSQYSSLLSTALGRARRSLAARSSYHVVVFGRMALLHCCGLCCLPSVLNCANQQPALLWARRPQMLHSFTLMFHKRHRCAWRCYGFMGGQQSIPNTQPAPCTSFVARNSLSTIPCSQRIRLYSDFRI